MMAPAQAGAKPAQEPPRWARRRPLDALFTPKTVAVIGATEKPGSVGRAVLNNLRGFGGALYPVNPNHARVLGLRTYPSIAAVPEKVDLALIVTPAPTVPSLVGECVRAGVGGAVILSAGFKESGPAGAALEKRILAEARRGTLRVIGPNCLGVMAPHTGLNATFASGLARPGNVAFISQSGALCTAILDWSVRENVGFSAFVSVGSMLDIGWGDLIYHLGDDPHTKSIVIYMESVGNARSFLSAAREVALTKPIMVIKVGRTEAAAKAAASHTGALTGSDETLEAALRRVGVQRVDTIEELFDLAEVLAKQPRPRGPHLAIVTNAGGPGALATDMLAGSGGRLAELGSGTWDALDRLLPPHWSRGNPIDLLGDASPERYAEAVALVAKDPNCDGMLVILTPQAMTDATATAEQLKPFAQLDGKPILASWMGGPAVDAGEAILNAAGIPTFRYPDRAARAFDLMWRYSENLRGLYETPGLVRQATVEAGDPNFPQAAGTTGPALGAAEVGSSRDGVDSMVEAVRKSGRTLLTEYESKQILSAYGIRTVETRVAFTEEEAAEQAGRLGYPVAVKLHSQTLTHKSDVGGVHLEVGTAGAVRRAWRSIQNSVSQKAGPEHFLGVTVQPMIRREGFELILGSSVDPQFGPVLLFGAGGRLVEVFKDRALGLPPLNSALARRLMEATRIFRALQGVRGCPPVDLGALEQVLVRFSQLVAEQRWLKEIDINPLLASPEGILALDARMVLHPPSTGEAQLPKLAIRPYPVQYMTRWTLKNGAPVMVRPIRPEDEPLLAQFHRTLSDRSVYYRYFTPLPVEQRIAHQRLARLCFIDYDREMALVVEEDGAGTGPRRILGVARLSKLHESNEAEFAIVISDAWQNLGLGLRLLRMLVRIGRDEKLERITAVILPDNRPMREVCRKAGFQVRFMAEEGECQAVLDL